MPSHTLISFTDTNPIATSDYDGTITCFAGDCSGFDVTDTDPIGSFTTPNPYAQGQDFDVRMHWADGSIGGATIQQVPGTTTWNIYATHHYSGVYQTDYRPPVVDGDGDYDGDTGDEEGDDDNPPNDGGIWSVPYAIEVRENNTTVGVAADILSLSASDSTGVQFAKATLDVPTVPAGESTPPDGPKSTNDEDPPVSDGQDGGLSVTHATIEAVEGQSIEGQTLATISDSGDPEGTLSAADYDVTVSCNAEPVPFHLEGGNGSYTVVADAFTPEEEGKASITIDVSRAATDSDDARSASATSRLNIDDAPLNVVGFAVNDRITSGTTWSGPVGTFTDGNPNATASDFHAVLGWLLPEDGPPANCTISGPDADGVFTVSATVTLKADADGATHAANLVVYDEGGSAGTDAVQFITYKKTVKAVASLTWDGMDQPTSEDPGANLQLNSSRTLNLSAGMSNAASDEANPPTDALQPLPDQTKVTLQLVSGQEDVEVWGVDPTTNSYTLLLGKNAPNGQSITWTKQGSGPDNFFPDSVVVTARNATDFDEIQFELVVDTPPDQSGSGEEGDGGDSADGEEAVEYAAASVSDGHLKVDFVSPADVANGSNLGDLTKDNPDKFGGGYRFFPDAKDLASGGQSRNLVRVRATIDGGVTAGTNVYFRAFDVDDPSKDATIDPNDGTVAAGLGGDNRGRLSNTDWRLPATSAAADAGGFQGLLREVGAQNPNPEHQTVGVPLEQNADGTLSAEIDLITSFAPGDNFVVVASLDDQAVQSLQDHNSSQVRTNGQVEGAGDNPQHEIVGSPQLSVWRHVHVERDKMSNTDAAGNPLGDSQVGQAAAGVLMPGLGAFLVSTTITTTAQKSYFGGILRDSNGNNYYIADNTAGATAKFIVIGPGARAGVAPAAGEVTVYQDDFSAANSDRGDIFNGNKLGTVAIANGQATVGTDRTLVQDEFTGGTLWQNGVQYPILSNTGGANASLVVSLPANVAPPAAGIGYSLLRQINNNVPKTIVDLQKDDSLYHRLKASTATAENPFSDAYIEPEYDSLKAVDGIDTNDVTGTTNLPADAASLHAFAEGFRGTKDKETDLYWAVHVTAAFQIGPDSQGRTYDYDPNGSFAVEGQTDRSDVHSENSFIFLETTRDYAMWNHEDVDEKLARITAHEVAHQFGLAATVTQHRPKPEDIMYADDLMNVPADKFTFATDDIVFLRAEVKSPGAS